MGSHFQHHNMTFIHSTNSEEDLQLILRFFTKRDEWADTFESILLSRAHPRTDCPEQLPTPVNIRHTEAKEDVKLSEFQRELIQLAAVHHELKGYPEKIGREMTVKQGKEFMEEAVKKIFEAGIAAKKMEVDGEQIIKIRPSLTTR